MRTIRNSKFFENRGSIFTIYNQEDISVPFVLDKVSKSYQGVIRGFHGDNKTWKLVTCLYGTFRLITYSVDNDTKEEIILSGDDRESVSVLISPRTLNAHQCLSDMCMLHYKWSHPYQGPENMWSVNYNDPTISPNWDLSLISDSFVNAVSKRDREAPLLKDIRNVI